MALFRPGGPIGAISGSIGALTFVARRQRPVVRARQQPRRVSTNASTTAQAALRHVIAAWTSLLASRKATWATLAATIRYTDALGQQRQPTGRQLFISHNVELVMAGQTMDTNTPPIAYDTSPLSNGTLSFTFLGVMQYTQGSGIGPLFWGISLYGQAFYRNMDSSLPSIGSEPVGSIPQKWKFIMWKLATSGTAFNINTEFTNALGSVQSGQVVAVRAKFVQAGAIATWATTTIAKKP